MHEREKVTIQFTFEKDGPRSMTYSLKGGLGVIEYSGPDGVKIEIYTPSHWGLTRIFQYMENLSKSSIFFC